MFLLTVKGDFASSHHLRDYEGQCKNLHGHTWKVEIVVQGEGLNGAGMLVDFQQIKKVLREILSGLDHRHLNDIAYFKENNPTSENLAKYIFDSFLTLLPKIRLNKVTVWESENASATYCL